MPNALGNTWPLPFLRRSEIINGKAAKTEIPRVVGGNVRALHEWTTGETSHDFNGAVIPPCAPLTGNTLTGQPHPGHDHSGGIMGVPIVRTVWLAVLGDTADAATKVVAGARAPRAVVSTAVTPNRTDVGLIDQYASPIWVPWGMKDGAYKSLWFMAYLYNHTAACDYTLHLQNAGDEIRETGALTTGYQKVTAVREIKCTPGAFQNFRVSITIQRDAADTEVSCLAWGLHQIKTDP